MNTSVAKKASAAVTVVLAKSRYGTPMPTIQVSTPRGTHHRILGAALHRIAAEVELATPATEAWVVQMQSDSDEHGYVYLELVDGDDAEAARAMAVLKKLVP